MPAIIGKWISDGHDAYLNLETLLKSRMLLQANSGAGKSWALRRALEQTYGRVPHLIIDVEDEFHTLREKFAYVIAAPTGGDVALTMKTAPLIVRRILEHRFNTIVNLGDLTPFERVSIVQVLLETLVAAPRSLWGQLLVTVDEAHLFCPQHGSAASADAVMALMTRGRKRGFCGVLATQRISKLHKDAAAECNTKLIGRAALDIDLQRAGDELGLTKDGRNQLRKLKAGQFFAFGPALCDTVELLQVGPVATTHPEPGVRSPTADPATRPVQASLHQVLKLLAELPKQAIEEAQTVDTLRADVKRLTGELKALERGAGKPVLDQAAVDAAVATETAKLYTRFESIRNSVIEHNIKIKNELGNCARLLMDPPELKVNPFLMHGGYVRGGKTAAMVEVAKDAEQAGKIVFRAGIDERTTSAKLTDGPRKILNIAATYEVTDMAQIAVLTGYKRSTRGEYVKQLVSAGYVTKEGDKIRVTDAGVRELGGIETLPTGVALRGYWQDKLPAGEFKVLEVAIGAYPGEVPRQSIEIATGLARSSVGEYVKRLAARKLVTTDRGTVRASELLF